MVGFGTALVAGPLLAQCVPVEKLVPLLAILDFSAATLNVIRYGKRADTNEIRRLIPWMAMGSLAGVCLLEIGSPSSLLLALGIFAICYGIYSLTGFGVHVQFTQRASIPFGLIGGVFSALFGSGGFIYAIYLSSRVHGKEEMRITQSTLIGLSTLTRVVLFLIAGVYADLNIIYLALMLVPAMLAGLAIGKRITTTISRQSFVRAVSAIVLCSGLALIWRYFQLDP